MSDDTRAYVMAAVEAVRAQQDRARKRDMSFEQAEKLAKELNTLLGGWYTQVVTLGARSSSESIWGINIWTGELGERYPAATLGSHGDDYWWGDNFDYELPLSTPVEALAQRLKETVVAR